VAQTSANETVAQLSTIENTGKQLRRWLSLSSLGPWIVVAALTAIYTVMSVAHYETSGAGSWDLGMFTEAVKQYAHFHAPIDDIKSPGFNILGDHFHPIIALLGPVFLLFPSPITLLVAQAFLFSLAADPIIRLGRDLISAGSGYALGIAYGLSFGIAQAANFDFHEIAFAVPIIAYALCALVRGNYRQSMWWCVALLFCKEDFGLFFVMPVGILMIAKGEIKRGVVLATVGTVATLLCVFVIIPHFNPQHQYQYWSFVNSTGSQTPQGINVGPVVGHFFSLFGTKFQLLYLLGTCVALVALRSPIILTAVLGLASRFVVTISAYWGTDYHYNAPVMPILFVAIADAMILARAAQPLPDHAWPFQRWARGVSTGMGQHGAVAALAVSVALIPQFALNQYFNLPAMFNVSARQHAISYAVSLVPNGVTVETNVCELAPLAARADTYWAGWNVSGKNPATQYILLDTQCFDLSSTAFGDPVTFEEGRHGGAQYKIIYQDDFGIYVMERIQ